MRALIVLALIGRVAAAQGIEASSVIAASATGVELDLAQPAFVTVLRVWPDTTAELAYPFDPLQSLFMTPPPVAQRLRFRAGKRHVMLPVRMASFVATVQQPDMQAGAMGYDNHCLMQQTAYLARSTGRPTPRFPVEPEAIRGSWVCAGSRPATVLTPAWHTQGAPERLGAHRVVVIVSERRLDLVALSRAAPSLSVADVMEPLRRVLGSQRGAWAAYVVPVD